MPDNVDITLGSGEKVAARDVMYSGENAKAQAIGLVLLLVSSVVLIVSAFKGLRTATELSADEVEILRACCEMIAANAWNGLGNEVALVAAVGAAAMTYGLLRGTDQSILFTVNTTETGTMPKNLLNCTLRTFGSVGIRLLDAECGDV